MKNTPLKNGFIIHEVPWNIYIKQKKNQVFKLLPLKEENGQWHNQLSSLLLELGGLKEQTEEEDVVVISIIAKLSALEDESLEFVVYRKTVFEIISLLEEW